MVKSGETSRPEVGSSSISRRDFLKIASLLGGGVTLLTACQKAGIDISSAPTPATGNESNPTPTDIEPTPGPEPLPTVTPELEAKLKAAGFTVEKTEEITTIRNEAGEPVLTATEASSFNMIMKDGSVEQISQELIDIRDTVGTVKNLPIAKSQTEQEKVNYFYMKEFGYWVPPSEYWPDAENGVSNAPWIDWEEDMWIRMKITDALDLKPFPKETLVPDGSFYNLHRPPVVDYYVTLNDSIAGYLDFYKEARDAINSTNDPRRWFSFRRSRTPKGNDMVIAAEQVLSEDGKTSRLFRYVFGQDFPWDENLQRGKYVLNIVDGIFKVKTHPEYKNSEDPGSMIYLEVRPLIYAKNEGNLDLFGYQAGNSAGLELYEYEGNKPVEILPDLLSNIQDTYEDLEKADPYGNSDYGIVDQAGNEMDLLENMGLTPMVVVFRPSKYHANQ